VQDFKNLADRALRAVGAVTRVVQPSPSFPIYTVSPQQRLVSVKFPKQLSIDDIRRYAEALCADRLFDPTFSEITDLSEVQELQLDAERALALADQIDPFSLGAKRAFVARTDLQVHAARMHQLLRNDEKNTRIFSSFADAQQWIQSADSD
jgi:hypothetical protein